MNIDLDDIFNSLNKKDRKELFEIKDDKLVTKVEEKDLKKAWDEWNKLESTYESLTSDEKKKIDLLPFIERVNHLKIKKTNEEEIDRVPDDLLENEEEKEIEKPLTETQLQRNFTEIVEHYFNQKPFEYDINKETELEVRFGTRGIKKVTKADYENVIKVLKSFGFTCENYNGFYSLRIQNEFYNAKTGRNELSNIRSEIQGLEQIQLFCQSNNLKDLLFKHANSVKFLKKSPVFVKEREKVKPVNFDDFNFRVSLQNEEKLSSTKSNISFILKSWRNNKKSFRFINRLTFIHSSLPIKVELSVVKSTDFGKVYFTTDEANIFQKPENYEIEIEVNNSLVGPSTNFKKASEVLDGLRQVIKYVLIGLQKTKFPIPISSQNAVLREYMKLLFDDEERQVYPNSFIGPSSYTLQRINIAPINKNIIVPNIRNNYTVTDKADGERSMMFINQTGRIYLLSSSMSVMFTGAKTENKEVFMSLMDGELITNDKNGKYINLFAAFDLYFILGKNVRDYPLIAREPDKEKSRLFLLNGLIRTLNPVSIMSKKENEVLSPMRFEVKHFYPSDPESDNIFTACDTILSKEKNGLFEYNTDGFIFTPAYFGVGSDKIGHAGPLKKITWEYSFKQKPAKFNTIDFLVTVKRDKDGSEIIHNIFENGVSTDQPVQLCQYKEIELRCSFIEKIHGYINPCQDVIDANFKENDHSTFDPKPVIFCPTKPYDPDAGICNILLRRDETNTMQMFTEEGDVFGDYMIVEFSYDLTKEKGWRWTPLRVRHDKTAELHQGLKNFGNAYHVANSNWQSIHCPITEAMICTGENIPEIILDEDVYYNQLSGSLNTDRLKNFHNLYVKKLLITSVSKPSDILIDFACGKAGDLSKWTSAELSFVFGIDISKDNLENRLDGACARYLNAKKQNKSVPDCLFVNGNSSFNIKDGSALRDEKAIQITKCVFGEGTNKESILGKGVVKHFGIGREGFNVSSCQFAIHYFFKDPETLKGFMKNLSECTKLGGYFIATTYDGKSIFKMLQSFKKDEGPRLYNGDKKVWELVKKYDSEKFNDDVTSLGLKIDVYQESINQMLSEYLVNFDYMNRIMNNFGFILIEREEANGLGLPEGSGMFSELFNQMENEIKIKNTSYGEAPMMTEIEKNISFLNRYFVYKKIATVNVNKVIIDVEGFEAEEEIKTKEKEIIQEEKPKVKKLKKKLVLVPSEEASENIITEKLLEKAKKKS
jgi:hypothetical protein